MKTLDEMTLALKEIEPSIEVNPSAFVSYIVKQFKKERFETKANELIRHFFNPKRYLKTVMSTLDSEQDVAQVLSGVLNRIQESKIDQKIRRPKKIASQVDNTSSSEGKNTST